MPLKKNCPGMPLIKNGSVSSMCKIQVKFGDNCRRSYSLILKTSDSPLEIKSFMTAGLDGISVLFGAKKINKSIV